MTIESDARSPVPTDRVRPCKGLTCRVRLGFVAWLLFALVCLVPGWFLSEWLAAEVQLENARPPIGRADWRRLGSPGVSHLCDVVLNDPSVDRRIRAAEALSRHNDPFAWRARLLSILDVDRRVCGAALASTQDDTEIAAAFDLMSDEELRWLLGHPMNPRDHGYVQIHIWRMRPQTAERLVSWILRTTDDIGLADEVTRRHFGYGCIVRSFSSLNPGSVEARNRAFAAGLGNPQPAIRELCKNRLAEEAGTDGAK